MKKAEKILTKRATAKEIAYYTLKIPTALCMGYTGLRALEYYTLSNVCMFIDEEIDKVFGKECN